MSTRAVFTLGLLLTMPALAASHQLDEYLQAARLDITRDRIVVDIALTPGVNVATNVVTLIDTNGDGELSSSERDAYARGVVKDLGLEVDGQRQRLALSSSQFPSLQEMTSGLGTIHIAAEAAITPASLGRHQLLYRNDHQAEIGVYLVNVLVPDTSEIEITRQHRDALQHGLLVGYTVSSSAQSQLPLVVFAVSLMALIGYRSRRFGPSALSFHSWFRA